MQVKNTSKEPIEIGHTTIAPEKVEEIDDSLLYQPRVQTLRACGKLNFPFVEPPAPSAPAERPKLTKKILDLVTEVKAPTESLVIEPKIEGPLPEDSTPKSKRK
jgi:hypothetical protein